MLERRREPRQVAFWNGKIGYNQRKFRMSCLVQNVSNSGAKLTVSYGSDVPDDFCLTIPRREVAYFVKVRWRKQEAIGVEIKSGTPACASSNSRSSRSNIPSSFSPFAA